MAFQWQAGWNDAGNNNGATQDNITTICATATRFGRGDAGLLTALTNASNHVSVVKGIHQEEGDNLPHITVDYSGGRWHVNLVQTSGGGVAGYRVGQCTQ
jgi:hypothetical protein